MGSHGDGDFSCFQEDKLTTLDWVTKEVDVTK
jgi:hypothetical protein